MTKADWVALRDSLLLFVPPMLGAWIGLRYAVTVTATQKLSFFITSAALSCYFGPALSDYLDLKSNAAAALTIVMASVGMEIMGGLVSLARQFGSAPLEVFKKVLRTWRGSEP